MNIQERQNEFENPGSEYRAKPFWAWNGKLEKNELLRQVDVLKEMGFGGFFMHSRTGLETEYLGKDWFDYVNTCADYAKSHDMQPWLYDEDRWPSGTGGGLTTADAAACGRYLEMIQYAPGQWSDALRGLYTQAVFAVLLDHGQMISYRPLAYGDVPQVDEITVVFCIRPANFSDNNNGYHYLNTLDRYAVQHFIDTTHEKYKKNCGDRMGDEICGIFTDEPHRGGIFTNFAECEANTVPYTEDLFSQFEKRFGYSLKERLPELFYQSSNDPISRTTHDFFELCQELFLERFVIPIRDWCHENNILFTGHMLHEDCLTSQAAMQGSLMRAYEYMDYPGIDFLGKTCHCPWIVKQLVSVTRQTQKRHALSELYACIGWQTDFATYKMVGDWQTFFGINLRCPHLSWYTMKGQCKRDYPASILHQSGWYSDFHYVEDYFSRIHAALDGAMADTGLLVINPIESVWARAYCGAFDRLEAQDTGIRRLEETYANVFTILESHQLDFDYGDEDILSRHAKVEGGVLYIGPCQYNRIVVAGLDTMRSSTLKLLCDFASQGGKVIFAGDLPGYVDAIPSTDPTALAARCTHVPLEESALASACTTGHEVTVIADNASQIYARSYIGKEPGERWVMLLNHDELHSCSMQVALGTGAAVERWDPRTGTVTTPAATRKDGNWLINLTLEPGGERLYRLPATARNLPAEPDYKPGRICSLPAAFRYHLTEPNVCVLDRVVVTAPGENPFPEQDVLMADNALRDLLDLPYRKRGMLQPWYQEKFRNSANDLRGQITVKYTVNVQDCPTDVMLAVEDFAHLHSATVNGIPLTLTSCGHWIDICYDKLSIPDSVWKQGLNEIVLKMGYYPTSGIEAAFLLGNFGVALCNDIPVLTLLPELLTASDVVLQGLPFYSGRIDYLLDTPISGDVLVTIREYGGALVKLFGSEEKIVAFPPYQAAIHNLHTIEVVLSRRNTFGPLHKDVPTGESSFTLSKTELSAYRPYLLEPQGLLTLPIAAELTD